MNSVIGLVGRFSHLFFALMVLGALNYGAIGLFDYDLFAHLFHGGSVEDIVYCLIAVGGLLSLDEAVKKISSHES